MLNRASKTGASLTSARWEVSCWSSGQREARQHGKVRWLCRQNTVIHASCRCVGSTATGVTEFPTKRLVHMSGLRGLIAGTWQQRPGRIRRRERAHSGVDGESGFWSGNARLRGQRRPVRQYQQHSGLSGDHSGPCFWRFEAIRLPVAMTRSVSLGPHERRTRSHQLDNKDQRERDARAQ